MLGAQWKPGCRTATLSAQGCSELESLRSFPAVTFKGVVSTGVKHFDNTQRCGLISSSEGNCAYSFVSTEHRETGTVREPITGKGHEPGLMCTSHPSKLCSHEQRGEEENRDENERDDMVYREDKNFEKAALN